MWTNKHIGQIPYNKVLGWAIVMKQNLRFGSLGSLDFMIFFVLSITFLSSIQFGLTKEAKMMLYIRGFTKFGIKVL